MKKKLVFNILLYIIIVCYAWRLYILNICYKKKNTLKAANQEKCYWRGHYVRLYVVIIRKKHKIKNEVVSFQMKYDQLLYKINLIKLYLYLYWYYNRMRRYWIWMRLMGKRVFLLITSNFTGFYDLTAVLVLVTWIRPMICFSLGIYHSSSKDNCKECS